jgi:hypothetical protein
MILHASDVVCHAHPAGSLMSYGAVMGRSQQPKTLSREIKNMRVQLNATVKGTVGKDKRETWPKGTTFDNTDNPIPRPILQLVEKKDPVVSILGEMPRDKSLEADLEEARKTIAELQSQIADLESQLEEAGLKTFICPVCEKPFPSQRGLSGHITKMHPDYEPKEEGGAI